MFACTDYVGIHSSIAIGATIDRKFPIQSLTTFLELQVYAASMPVHRVIDGTVAADDDLAEFAGLDAFQQGLIVNAQYDVINR